jgi:hypothetical protein
MWGSPSRRPTSFVFALEVNLSNERYRSGRAEIPYHMAGTHRRIYIRDLLVYKAKRDSKRRQGLDELTRAEAEDALYGLEPPDDRAQ